MNEYSARTRMYLNVGVVVGAIAAVAAVIMSPGTALVALPILALVAVGSTLIQERRHKDGLTFHWGMYALAMSHLMVVASLTIIMGGVLFPVLLSAVYIVGIQMLGDRVEWRVEQDRLQQERINK